MHSLPEAAQLNAGSLQQNCPLWSRRRSLVCTAMQHWQTSAAKQGACWLRWPPCSLTLLGCRAAWPAMPHCSSRFAGPAYLHTVSCSWWHAVPDDARGPLCHMLISLTIELLAWSGGWHTSCIAIGAGLFKRGWLPRSSSCGRSTGSGPAARADQACTLAHAVLSMRRPLVPLTYAQALTYAQVLQVPAA